MPPVMKPKLSDSFKDIKVQGAKSPLWSGPNGDGPNGGLSQSMIGKFLECRVRFGVKVIDGLSTPDSFKPAIEYGNMWHCCEEASEMWEDNNTKRGWRPSLKEHITVLANKYPQDREKISHWYDLCCEQYPIYLDYWDDSTNISNTKKEGEIIGREPLEREQQFDIKYRLPSGREVRLRGKRDGLDLVQGKPSPGTKWAKGSGPKGLYLYENKTKSQIDVDKIRKQLKFDLQTMYYIIALQEELNSPDQIPEEGLPRHALKGVLYNVIKRSAHKSSTSMMKKIQEDIEDNRGGEWFSRFTVDISQYDIDVFKKTCLHPILEQICVWWDIVSSKPDTPITVSVFTLRDMMNYRHPSGQFNEVDENGATAVDYYLETGSAVGLTKIKTLFPELD